MKRCRMRCVQAKGPAANGAPNKIISTPGGNNFQGWNASPSPVKATRAEQGPIGLYPMSDPFMNMKRSEFISFCKAATKDRQSPEYDLLYRFLLHCFVTGDGDCDGKVSFDEFNMMIEQAAFTVRRLGLAPSTANMFKTPAARDASRMKMFNDMDVNGQGYIAFEDWLDYTTDHIIRKVASVPDYLMNPSADPNMNGSMDQFLAFMEVATSNRDSLEFRELYTFLLDCFVQADQDCDGKVSLHEFDAMVEVAAELPRYAYLCTSYMFADECRHDHGPALWRAFFIFIYSVPQEVRPGTENYRHVQERRREDDCKEGALRCDG